MNHQLTAEIDLVNEKIEVLTKSMEFLPDIDRGQLARANDKFELAVRILKDALPR